MDNINCASPGNQPTSGFNDSECKDKCDQSHCECGDDLSVMNDNKEEAIEEEVLGKEFMDVESAHKFYVNYGGKHGFNVKIRNSRKNNANFVKWVLVYGRDTFTADMKSTQRSEGMNNVLKKYLKPEHNLLRFFEHYERVLSDRRYEELCADFKMIDTTPVLAISAHMLEHGAEVYTPEVFLLFQKEFVRIHNYSVHKVGKNEMTSEYIVSYSSEHNEHLVRYEALTHNVSCSCKKM
ncbi:hypothetical protein OROHE_012435 [Orobanche hederae]